MSKETSITKVHDFLIQNMLSDLIRKTAEQEIADINLTNNSQRQITKAAVDKYIALHYEDLRKKSEKTLRDTAEELVKDYRRTAVIKDLGVLSLILVPPMYPIGQYLLKILFEGGGVVEGAMCIVSLLLLSFPIVSYLRSLFK
ncbi:MAG: hypothetical protein II922_10710 [Succinimonas sp.]|nr:hypothetical protein [Succinimonas sp.]